jgi:hypothetical protein
LRKKLSAEEEAKLEGEFLEKARSGFKRMFGEGKLDELRTFVQKDDQASEIVEELWQWMMEKHIEKDEQTEEVDAKRRCPWCGGIGKNRGKDTEHRDLIGQHGSVGFDREGCYCGRCRKVFFPSGSAA